MAFMVELWEMDLPEAVAGAAPASLPSLAASAEVLGGGGAVPLAAAAAAAGGAGGAGAVPLAAAAAEAAGGAAAAASRGRVRFCSRKECNS